MEKKRICIVGAGPCGMSALYHFANVLKPDVEIVCYEKQDTYGGLWNYSWLTGTDSHGDPCHAGMYRHLWSNGPKECLEYPDYTFEQHFGRKIPSYPPRPVLKDYLEGRAKTSRVPIEKFITFNTAVRHVEYLDDKECFRVASTNLNTNNDNEEMFSHVIVAVGIFNVPKKPSFEGIETFPGRIIHSHDVRNANEFKGHRVLVIGASKSAEDIALQCKKFGAQNIVCTWRTKPIGYKWPAGIEERPLFLTIKGNKVTFKDGSQEEFDSIILCTGYLYSFPFMEKRLRLTSPTSFYPENLYKGSLWLSGGNNKLFYMGIQDQIFSFTLFDVQAAWIVKYIMKSLPGEPSSHSAMEKDAQKWVSRREKLNDCHDQIDFQSAFMEDLAAAAGFNKDIVKAAPMFHVWENNKREDVASYREKRFRSIYTGNEASLKTVNWWEAFDDSIETFVGK